MNIINPRTIIVTALAVVALSITSKTHAALTYTDGDLILGFRATGGTGGTTNVLFDIGSAAIFRDATTQLTLSIGNVGADLSAIFGASWNTRIDVDWSVSGTQFSAGNGFTTNRNLIATRAQGFPIAPLGSSNSTPWNKATLSTQGGPALKLQQLGGKFGAGTTGGISGTDQIESTNAPGFGLIQPSTQNNSFEEFMAGGAQSTAGSSYAYFNGGVEGNFGNGTSGAALDLYYMVPGSGAGTYEGTFTINDNATITFTPTGVPEPGTATILGLGCAALLTKRRRQVAA